MRTSPRWTCSSRPHHQASCHRQVGRRVQFGFSQHACTKMMISPSYGIQIRHSWMHWNHDDKMLLLVRVLGPKTSWIILCDIKMVLHPLFWAFLGLVSCRALSPYCGHPTPGRPTLGRPWFPHKLSSRRHLDLGFV